MDCSWSWRRSWRRTRQLRAPIVLLIKLVELLGSPLSVSATPSLSPRPRVERAATPEGYAPVTTAPPACRTPRPVIGPHPPRLSWRAVRAWPASTGCSEPGAPPQPSPARGLVVSRACRRSHGLQLHSLWTVPTAAVSEHLLHWAASGRSTRGGQLRPINEPTMRAGQETRKAEAAAAV